MEETLLLKGDICKHFQTCDIMKALDRLAVIVPITEERIEEMQREIKELS